MGRGLLFIYLSIFIFLINVSVSLQGDTEECGEQLINYYKRMLDAPVQDMIIFDDYKTIFILTTAGTLYRSNNNGHTWENQVSYLQGTDEETPFVREIIKTAVTGRIYILGATSEYWTSSANSNTYVKYDQYFVSIKPNMNSKYSDYALALSPSSSCSSVTNCYTSLYITEDFGESWTHIRDYVYKYEWGSGYTIYLTSVDSASQVGNQFSILKYNYRLYYSQSFGDKYEYESPKGYTDFYISNSYVYITVEKQPGDLSLMIYDGSIFYPASFNDPLFNSMPSSQSAYRLLTNTEYSTFINVQLTDDSRYGAIYEADTADAEFWISLRYNRIKNNAADFVSNNGFNGIFYANRYNVSSEVSLKNLEQVLETVISFDNGAVWQRVALPSDSNCQVPNCALHFYGPTDSKIPQMLSSSDAVGIVLATGNEGIYRSIHSDSSATYLSRNTGYTWEKIKDGVNAYSFTDHGSLFLLATLNNATNIISYSWNQGLNWTDCSFSDSFIEVTKIINLGESRSFMMIGEADSAGVVITFNLTNTLTTECTGMDTPTQQDSDFEIFYQSVNGECLLGANNSYVRRKRDVSCYVGDIQNNIYSTSSCPCVREDYECDGDCFEERFNSTSGETECVNICLNSPNNPQAIPENCTGTIMITQGYRKVPGDKCEGGLDLLPIPYDCNPPPPSSNSSDSDNDTSLTYNIGIVSISFFIGIVVCFVIFILIIVLFVAYRKNSSVYGALSPFIPRWCTKQEEDDAYSTLDFSTTNSLLDEDIE